jgi:hypothetical protein
MSPSEVRWRDSTTSSCCDAAAGALVGFLPPACHLGPRRRTVVVIRDTCSVVEPPRRPGPARWRVVQGRPGLPVPGASRAPVASLVEAVGKGCLRSCGDGRPGRIGRALVALRAAGQRRYPGVAMEVRRRGWRSAGPTRPPTRTGGRPRRCWSASNQQAAPSSRSERRTRPPCGLAPDHSCARSGRWPGGHGSRWRRRRPSRRPRHRPSSSLA